MKKIRLCLFLFGCVFGAQGQEIQGQLLDSLTQERIPFATVLSNFGENTISNEEGKFRLIRGTAFQSSDSLFISCMGYNEKRLAITELADSLLYLSPKEIELNAVILSQQNLSAEEIVKRTRENVAQKYDLGLSKKTFFLRESFSQRWLQRDMAIKKSTINEFKQSFWDSLFRTIPEKDTWHTESLGELAGDWSEEQQKLHLLRAVDLADTVNAKGYEQIEEKITSILDESVKENSYFKFKSGIFSTKVDRDEVIEKELDTLSLPEKEQEEKRKAEQEQKEGFYKGRKNRLTEIFTSLIKRDRLDIDVLIKSHLYTYELVNFTYREDLPVYHIRFTPNSSKGKYEGSMYVDADSFSLIQLEYDNVQNLRDFSLMGLSFSAYGRSVKLKFSSFNKARYQLAFLTVETKFKTGIDRPIKIVEKNKFVKGRRKQNELKGEVHFKLDQKSSVTLVIFNSETVSQEGFENFEETKVFKAAQRNAYDPKFWEGYTIIEPNEAIKAFTTN